MKLLVYLLLFACTITATAQSVKQELTGRAPELKVQKGWLNTDKPLSLADLKGKIVLLDFWTYGCINCIHVIPDLKRLEAKYKNELVVIGVHSGLFTNEKDTENIRHIILRYGLEHPIVNDGDFKIWKAYKVNAYPTQVIIDPNGDVVATTTSEGQLGVLNKIIGETAAKFRAGGTLNEKPMTFALERDKYTDGPLAFAGKILADAKSNRLFIADTGHNRIVVSDLAGKLIEVIGSGQPGRQDGGFETARFYRPQGLALDGDTLYVADTSNQLIRRVDLASKKVETIAGTGVQRRQEIGGPAATATLNSPWDLLVVGRQLFIAMAGNHQVWVMDVDKKTVEPFAGTGDEGLKDGTLETATFAQPSALAYDGKNLYVADPERNRIRAIDLSERKVRTLPNTDIDPEVEEGSLTQPKRLQHPAGIAMVEKNLIIADTYNHQIKQVNPDTGYVKTLFGDGKYERLDGKKARFYEPGGISVAGERAYVADTNNHSIRVIDLNGKTVQTLTITGLQPPKNNEVQ
ncbi:MAG TPA: thioredoxin-like domain-containing protein [Pyrinomonadaceae bacterium]|nr:thioredoxin-like domain-containing protein [Pyrinomonadaceae bacterium]